MSKMYLVQCRETCVAVEVCSTLELAERALKGHEEMDKKKGTYTPDFYEIVEWSV